jgi:hypothetical protein
MNEDCEKDDLGPPEPEDTLDRTFSRRNWLVTIGQAAISLGLSNNLPADTNGGPSLPPGLYLPSTNHLGHALMATQRFHPIPPDCPTDYIRPPKEPFTPLFFSKSEFAIISRIVQLLLGEAEEKSAGDASITSDVAAWIDLCVANGDGVRQAALHLEPACRAVAVGYYGSAHVNAQETADPVKICREGLTWLSADAQSLHSKGFLLMTEEQQTAVLNSVSDSRADRQIKHPGARFFTYLKAETIRGFYTSQTGLKELNFRGNSFYARSPGCATK